MDAQTHCLVFGAAALAGLAALLRSGQALSRRLVISHALNAGLFGSACACLLRYYKPNEPVELVFGLTILSGLAGPTIIEQVTANVGGLWTAVVSQYARSLNPGPNLSRPTIPRPPDPDDDPLP